MVSASSDREPVAGIDTRDAAASREPMPYNAASFEQIRVLEAWSRYRDRLTWGRGQCLAILDDGCDLNDPAWRVRLPWGPKVIASHNSIDGNDDPTPVPPGYHGTSVGYPSSLNHQGIRGIAYNNSVAQVRCVSVVHLGGRDEAPTIERALRWVRENRVRLAITAVNLSPLDDQAHPAPVMTSIDGELEALRREGVWVSAPCGNHDFADGVSWPACQPGCFGIGATVPGRHEVHLDRSSGTDLLVTATATSSSNAYAAASAMVLREAIEKAGYPWRKDGPTLPDAILGIFRRTAVVVMDPETNREFRELDLLAALDGIYGDSG